MSFNLIQNDIPLWLCDFKKSFFRWTKKAMRNIENLNTNWMWKNNKLRMMKWNLEKIGLPEVGFWIFVCMKCVWILLASGQPNALLLYFMYALHMFLMLVLLFLSLSHTTLTILYFHVYILTFCSYIYILFFSVKVNIFYKSFECSLNCILQQKKMF